MVSIPAKRSQPVVVETRCGMVRGLASGSAITFKGIPYGATVSGRFRFQTPRAAEAWSGVRDAFAYGPMALQQPPPEHRTPSFLLSEMSEDCLVLNLWTSRTFRPGEKRPVMVWLHGGGFSFGSAAEEMTDGTNFATQEDVVLVSLNHRLNIFGHLFLDDIGDDRFVGSGNAGMLDVVLALKWVRDNITSFGGDPGNVTIFGESGGGGKVAVLLAMPCAAGLFHRAIIQSGPNRRAMTREMGQNLTTSVLSYLELPSDQYERLLEIPHETLLSAFQALAEAATEVSWLAGLTYWDKLFAPILDGVILPQHPFDPIAPAISAAIPVMIGTTADEYAHIADQTLDTALGEADVIKRIGELGVAEPARLFDHFARSHPEMSPREILINIMTQKIYRTPTVQMADLKAAQQSEPVYMYVFEAGVSIEGKPLRAIHGLDVPFVFGNMRPAPNVELDAALDQNGEPLSSLTRRAWAAFAQSGDPNCTGLPEWPRYTAQARSTMVFNTTCRVQASLNDTAHA